MIILGIDPGLRTVGLGLITKDDTGACHANEWLTIETKTGMPLCERLKEIAVDLTEYIALCKPDLIVVETLFFQTNRKTAIDVAQARGVILHIVASHTIPLLEVNPLELKLAVTGDGKADKKQMQDMIVRTFQLNDIPSPDDAVDALGLALFGAYNCTVAHSAG